MKQYPGYTLVELIIALGIAGVLSTAVVILWTGGLQTFRVVNFNQQRDSLFLETFNRMTRDVRTAYAFPTNYTVPGGATFSTVSPNTIILQLYGLKPDGTADCTITDHVVYTSTNGELVRYVFADPESSRPSAETSLLKDVSNVTFAQAKDPVYAQDHREIDATIRVTRTELERTIDRTHTRKMVARND